MPETLPVHLNRESIHDVETPASFDAGGTFSVVVENHGSDSHVHLHLDDDLSRIARIDAGNHYVEGGTTRSVTVSVAEDAAGSGYLDVVTGYGAERESVAITIDPDESEAVTVDEDLSTPQTQSASRSRTDSGRSDVDLEDMALPIGIVAVGILVVAVVVAVSSELGALVVGGLAVVIGVIVAAYFVLTA